MYGDDGAGEMFHTKLVKGTVEATAGLWAIDAALRYNGGSIPDG
jgi:hypothetical protein